MSHLSRKSKSSWLPRTLLPALLSFGVVLGVTVVWERSGQTQSAGSDLPGFGGETLRPRLMVVLDTSASMRFDPGYTVDRANDDFVASPRTPDSSCLSKFCIGKRAMYDVLSANASLVEIGLAGYFQSEKTVHHDAVSSNYNITCKYDVLASAGQFINSGKQQWTSVTDLAPSVADGVGFSCSPETQSTVLACATAMPDHTCTRTTSSGTTLTLWQNPACAGSATLPLACTPSATITSGSPASTYSYNASSSGWDTSSYKLVQKSTAGAACTPTTYLAQTSGNSCTSGATGTPNGKCDFYLDTTVGTPAGTVFQTSGTTLVRYATTTLPTTVSGKTYTQLNSSSGSTVQIVAASAATSCPATQNYTQSTAFVSGTNPGCNTVTGGCALTGGTGSLAVPITVAADNKTAYVATMTVAGYTLVSVTPTTSTAFLYSVPISSSCGQAPGAIFNVTASTYQGLSVGCGTNTTSFGSASPCLLVEGAETLHTDLGTRDCRFTRNTYTYNKPASTTGYECQYTLTKYTYGYLDEYCRYRRYQYKYTNASYTYKWNTNGGEIINSYTTAPITVTDNTVCGTAVSNTKCADVLSGTTAPSVCRTSGASMCKLRAQSRYSWSNPAATSSTTATYCFASDLLSTTTGATPPMINTTTTRADWCALGGTGGTPAYDDPPILVGDYYDPATANTAVTNVSWSPPLHATKDTGWSYYVSGANAGTAATAFVPVALNTASAGGAVLNMLQDYNAISNPTGLRMPDAANGPYTPLYGSLTSTKAYLQTLINADSNTACRPYYVLLVTDGDEDTPKGYTQSDLVNVVNSLRTMSKSGQTVDVKTFVVGFGVTSAALDAMAVAGGQPYSNNASPPTLSAYNAADASALSEQLNAILGVITSGTYSRTKPVLTNDGARIYAGYFSHSTTGLEWPGFLDTYSIDSGVISTSPIWSFQTVLNAQAAGSRTIYTRVTGDVGLTPFELYANGQDPSRCTLVDDIAGGIGCASASRTTADKIVKFVRNDRTPTPTFSNSTTAKSSRLSDIYHSTPAAVAGPIFSAAWGVGPAEQVAYQAFKNVHQDREPTVYVGSNDGVVHAIRDYRGSSVPTGLVPGQERWGYVPHGLLPGLSASLAQHAFTADGNFAISDVCTGSGCTQANGNGWQTALIGSLGRGGSSLFALDISDAANPQYMWDVENEPNMGETWSGPVVARVSPLGVKTFGAFVGGGYSTLADHGNYFYIFDALTGAIMSDGTTPAKWAVASVNRPTVKNNLPSRARIVRPSDGSMASIVYFGDTDGKVMRMSVTSNQVSNWAPQVMFNPFSIGSGCAHTSVSALPDETVTAVTLPLTLPPSNQPFPQLFNRPIIGDDDGTKGTGRKVLYLGTGDANNPSDATTQDYFYAVRDDHDVLPAPSCLAPALWAKKLALGDKVLGDPAILGSNIVVAVYKPPTAVGTCGSSGHTTLYCFDKITGANSNCLVPTATVATPNPSPTSYLDVGSVGIISDITVIGSSLLFNASSEPENIRQVGLVTGPVPFQVKTWERVQ